MHTMPRIRLRHGLLAVPAVVVPGGLASLGDTSGVPAGTPTNQPLVDAASVFASALAQCPSTVSLLGSVASLRVLGRQITVAPGQTVPIVFAGQTVATVTGET